MKSFARTPRIPIACPCGARVSVIPSLEGTEIHCPRCQKTLNVPGTPLVESAGSRGFSAPEPSTTELSYVAGPAAELAQEASHVSLDTLYPAIGMAVNHTATPQCNSRDKPLNQMPIISSSDRSFPDSLNDPVAGINCSLDEKTPKSLLTLCRESQQPPAVIQRHIDHVLKEKKARAVTMDTGEVGYVIDPDWLSELSNSLPAIHETRVPAVSPVLETSQSSTHDWQHHGRSPKQALDIFGRIIGHGAAHMNTFLSSIVPQTVQRLRELSGYEDTANHVWDLHNEGKIRQVSLHGGQVGWIIDPDWLKTVDVDESAAASPTCETGASDPSNERPRIGSTETIRKKTVRGRSGDLFEAENSSAINASRPASSRPLLSMPQTGLTSVQRKLYQFIEHFYETKQNSPTIQEIQEAIELSRFETLNQVDAIVRSGLLEFDRSSARGIRIVPESERGPIVEQFVAGVVQQDVARKEFFPGPRHNEAMNAWALTPSGNATLIESSKTGDSLEETAEVVPEWVDSLLASDAFHHRCNVAGRRVPTRSQFRNLLALLAVRGLVLTREAVCASLAIPLLRYDGFIAIVFRILNVDDGPVLIKTESPDGLRLNLALLRKSFGLPE